MITEKERDNLKPGDKLIFWKHGGTLSTSKGNVFTFSNWFKPKNWPVSRTYWQCQEVLDTGNHDHNYDIWATELFDEKKHVEFNMMSPEKVREGEANFIREWGGVDS